MKKYSNDTYADPNGVKRWDLINHLIKNYDFLNYLEIGVNDGVCIRKINVPHKDGVDPSPGSEVGGMDVPEINYPITSDEFFNFIKGHDIKYDVIFIDGLHHSDQVDKDIKNSLNHLVPNGFIILHDCNPLVYEMQIVPRVTGLWNGDVWKSITRLRCIEPNLEVMVVDMDWGVGIVKKGNQTIYDKSPLDKCLTWEYFDEHRIELNNLITVKDFYNKF
jgi:hypothetical protein